MICPLCKATCQHPILKDRSSTFYRCPNCDLRFLDPEQRLNSEEEKKRYLTHNNDVLDPRYQSFVKPLYLEIRKRLPPGSSGLDFGAGTGPVLAMLLRQDGYPISLYDPYFWPDQQVLEEKYDFVCACEVIEHLYDPAFEFKRMSGLLKGNGLLAFMTQLYDEEIDFGRWYYRKDPTHVVFYSRRTFSWIQTYFGFSKLTFNGSRVILLQS